MIGKPQWFGRRKYGGWGVFPKTWQGWVYTVVFLAGMFIINTVPFPAEKYRNIAFVIWAVILAVDVVDMMIRLPLDEREKVHEAIAERNALWVMLLALVIGLGYKAAAAAMDNQVYVDPVIIAAIAVGLIAKACTNIYLERKD